MARTFELAMTADELSAFFVEAFPGDPQRNFTFDRFEPGFLRIKMVPDETMLRPGELVSGPTQMALADRAAYAVILAHIGPVAMAVTSNLNMSFLRGVKKAPVFADTSLLKLGRKLASVDVRLWQGEETHIVAQSTVTYAIP
ncbi:PaaI family thioesterase [Parerythrobacter aestuarii]|uniref:PaaI family thioesterase n=1 Tax=Parerythrobacter aestuarii TaxID=3020909 RepID=UPI0024DE6D7E|nr:PaaI family thioesterase [Parerythrobacter aestuarii]